MTNGETPYIPYLHRPTSLSFPPLLSLNALNTVSSALNTVEYGAHHSQTHVAQAWRRTVKLRLPQHNRAPDCPAHGLSTQDNNKVLSDGDESDTMSVLLSISSILSLLTFFTTVLALVRVGTAAFASNQPFKQQAPGISMQPLRLQWAGDGMSLSKAMRLGMKDAREEERANGAELENGYLGAGAPLLRMSSVGMLSPSGRPREYSFISICYWLSYLAVLLQLPHIPE